MNTKLLALAFLASRKRCHSAEKMELLKELSGYTTERLFKMMEEVDKNPSFDPAVIFEVIEERGGYTGKDIIAYLKAVKYGERHHHFKRNLCGALLRRDDCGVSELHTLFVLDEKQASVFCSAFIDNKALLREKFAQCEIKELCKIASAPNVPVLIADAAKSIAESRLSELPTNTLLELLHKGTKVCVGHELESRTKELEEISSL